MLAPTRGSSRQGSRIARRGRVRRRAHRSSPAPVAEVGRATVGGPPEADARGHASDLGVAGFERDEPGSARTTCRSTSPTPARRSRSSAAHEAVVARGSASPAAVAQPGARQSSDNDLRAGRRRGRGRACAGSGAARRPRAGRETAAGMAHRRGPVRAPTTLQVDEQQALRPQEPTRARRSFGEQLMDAAVRRSDVRCISIRAGVGAVGGQRRAQPRPARGRRGTSGPTLRASGYADALRPAQALRLAADEQLPSHEVFYVAQDDSSTGRPAGRARRRARSAEPTRSSCASSAGPSPAGDHEPDEGPSKSSGLAAGPSWRGRRRRGAAAGTAAQPTGGR